MVNPLKFLKKQRSSEKNPDLKEPLVEVLNESKSKGDEPNFLLKVWLAFFFFSSVKEILQLFYFHNE